ncbi:peptidoglycan recognition protein family protein [Anaerosporobacter faecicola]|uniref:peptidoglycan recognition protein family protein n=1 Tax=Anaerosporobacter faecicola TaxID=2718714 RepID=UPI00143A663C|nr:peptidoglycan recognition family protein [Anaerosporobacter faecicola]
MRRKLTREQYRRKKKMKRLLVLSSLILLFITGVGLIGGGLSKLGKSIFHQKSRQTMQLVDGFYEKLEVEEMLLTPNEYSRPQIALNKVNGVVIHYTANPGTDAEANRNYFEGLKEGKTYSNGNYIYSSSNFIVGLKGNIVQCVPLNEIAYASNERNEDTISIEVCHPDDTGKFTKKSYKSLVKLTAWICSEYNLQKEDIIRHYDVTGKQCPKYYVEHEEEWLQFKEDVFQMIEENAKNEEKK